MREFGECGLSNSLIFPHFLRFFEVIYINNQILKLTSPIPPSVNHYLAYRAVIKNKRPLAFSYKTSDAIKFQKDFVDYLRSEVAKQGWLKSENKFLHYYMDCIFYFGRSDMDANNYFKVLADSITDSGCVWIDDTQLCERVQKINYDSTDPRIEITITPVDYIGIFSDISQLEIFISNCIQCSKYKDGKCNLLERAKQGRIQEQIKNNKCLSFKKENNNG